MPRVINFEGRRITLADDLTDDDVSAILHAPRITVTPQADPLKGPPVEASRGGNPEGGFTSSLGVGAQGVGRGLASVAGAPVDLTTGLLNLLPMASNAIFGTEFEGIKKPFLGSEQIREDATRLFEPLGVKVRSEAEMTPGQKLGYNISNYGTQFAVPAGGVAAAGRVARQVAPTVPGRIADTFRRPYAEAPMRTVAGDTAGGVGAGVATDFVQNNVAPDSPFRVPAEIAAVLGGGVGGSTALGVGESIGNLFRSLQMRGTDVGVGVKNPQTNAPFSQLDTERTARTMQEAATNPALAAREIDEGSRALTNPALPGEAPLATGEIPTSGLLSRDPGLVNLEQRARMQNAPDFVQRDQGVKRAAAERVESLKDPDADPSVVSKFMEEEPKRLAKARDDEALPLLREAEASGVQVDATPVAALIDEKLATAKRPPVRAALTEARKLLNKVGSDDLDTSVSGLYETRKAVNDVIEGRGENATGRFASKELLEVRDALDNAIVSADSRFAEYLERYKEGSKPVNEFTTSEAAQSLTNAKMGDVRNTAAEILNNSAYGTERRVAEIEKLVGSNPEVKTQWKNAVAEVLTDRVTSTRQTGETFEVQFARLAKEFKDNEQVLARVFTPEEMNTLRQAHTLLGYFKEAEKRALVGSQTAERMQIPGWVQLLTRHIKGDLAGGGLIRRFKLMVELLPSNREAAEQLMAQAWFDPKVAAYLLRRDVRSQKGEPRSVPLGRAEAAAAGGRASSEENE